MDNRIHSEFCWFGYICFLVCQSGLLDSSNGLLGITVIKAAIGKVSLPFGQALIRGILCNIMVVLAVWMATTAKDITGKILAIWFPYNAFRYVGFEHSVANMYFIPALVSLQIEYILFGNKSNI